MLILAESEEERCGLVISALITLASLVTIYTQVHANASVTHQVRNGDVLYKSTRRSFDEIFSQARLCIVT